MKSIFFYSTLLLVWSLAVDLVDSPTILAQQLTAEKSSSKPERSGTASALAPGYCLAAHNIGNMAFAISNFGRIGVGDELPAIDCFTGLSIPSCQFPKGASVIYLYKGGIWIGGIVGTDTLVSCGTDFNNHYREFNPDPSPLGNIIKRSTTDPLSPQYEGAISEQDYIAQYTDTVTLSNPYPSFDQISNQPHHPLGLKVIQSSYGWSYGYAADFTLFNLRIKNIGKNKIKQAYVGIYMDFDVGKSVSGFSIPNLQGNTTKQPGVGVDDLTGFLLSVPATYENQPCLYDDTVRLAWTADNDGDPSIYDNTFLVPNAIGVRFLRPPSDQEVMSYNWWVPNYNPNYDYGPQLRKNYRFMGGGSGTPYGDRNKYAMMSNGEIDFDQAMIGLKSALDPNWVIPGSDVMYGLVRGGDNSLLLSIGPYDMNPGSEVSVPFALVGGENFHTDPTNFFYNIRWQYSPEQYYAGLNFADFAKNAAWAAKVYDNPGVDTDTNGYAGKFHVCVVDSQFVNGHWAPTVADTIYYEGDGVPDWRAASPPPPPKVWVYPKLAGLKVRFNGYRSETTKDFLSNILDFEGYRVYMGRDEREASFSLMGSYDREDYDVYFYDQQRKPKPAWVLEGIPVTRQQLRCRFSKKPDPCNDTTFNPLLFGVDSPWRSGIYPDSIFYFAPHEANASQFGVNTPIFKRYPQAPMPADPQNPQPSDLTDDGYLKYWDYECDINNLLPTVPYFVNVTAFDFGSPNQGLLPLETNKTLNPVSAFPAADANQLTGVRPPVYIYPNPYRIDQNYRANGYEGYGQFDKADDRVRAINFVNLPPKCTIRILTLDGDLVRQIDHNVSESDPKSGHDAWDMISRNTQAVVSGIYYWTVEDATGKVQIGKLVIIM